MIDLFCVFFHQEIARSTQFLWTLYSMRDEIDPYTLTELEAWRQLLCGG